MKIVFTGGGTGGHFYPLIAVAQKVNKILDDEKIVGTKLYYISDSPYDKEMLFENRIAYIEISTGKLRLYSSFKSLYLNFFDLWKTSIGVIKAIRTLFSIYPDVVFSKGGYASFPTICAARILFIPVIIHESDSAPGRVNKWAGRFAKKIAISFKNVGSFFPAKKVAYTGQPIRTEIEHPALKSEAFEYFKLESNLPVVLILGGSQGAELINHTVLDALPRLIKNYQVIHQTGVRNFEMVSGRSSIILDNEENKSRYISMPFLNSLTMKMAAGAATIIISRAGSTIFEIASWGIPAILIPFTSSNGDHSKKNAFDYARAGACSVIEESNMTGSILSSEVERIIEDKESWKEMSESAKAFNKPGAAMKIARAIIDLALSHEK
ncbi:MAG: UDP-N-acetylglucosamine--N-acetylmuramyl-(pentapeptide) pyrophosphoryl-undecaprenol N-acetylglucosamine transferase [Patescibacteria group bacterium]